jgi:hypothetical protein
MVLTLYSNMIKGVANHNSIVKSYSMNNGQSAAKLPVKDEGSETKEVDLIFNLFVLYLYIVIQLIA